MPSVDSHTRCVACGNEMTHVLRAGYRRCHDCVAADRPYSLALARLIRASKRQATHGLDDYDPTDWAAA